MSAWSNIEVELIVADYFSMLTKELSGQAYKKSEHRKALLPLLDNRSEGSVEFKHQNISAVLNRLGQPSIKGYLPRYNYQSILEERVIDHLIANPRLELLFKQFADARISAPGKQRSFDKILVQAPEARPFVEEPPRFYQRNPIKINYLEKEQRNTILGRQGEELIVEYEKWNLITLGKESLADKVEWVSREQGDGAGFDILSRNLDGSDKYIEVKTTRLGKETPFFFSRNELLFSQDNAQDFHLYRLFNFQDDAKLFIKNGSLDRICTSVPVEYRGVF